jgi:hypothetical protein
VPIGFDLWLKHQFAATGPFTALIILVRIDGTAIAPLGSSYAAVIGDALDWLEMCRLLDGSRLAWNGAVIFPVLAEAGGPLSEEQAKQRLSEVQARVLADRLVINEGFFFDRLGRRLQVEESDDDLQHRQ